MQTLELTPDEAEVLRDELDRRLSEIDVEVFHTDARDFKEMLKRRRDLVERIHRKLALAPVVL